MSGLLSLKLLLHISLRNPKKVSNVRALQIFERKVLLSILDSRKFSNATFFRQIALQNLQRKKLGFSETNMTISFVKENLRWPITVTATANYSQHKRIDHNDNKNLTSRSNSPQHKQDTHSTNENSHSTNESFHNTNENFHSTNENSHSTNQNSHSTTKSRQFILFKYLLFLNLKK